MSGVSAFAQIPAASGPPSPPPSPDAAAAPSAAEREPVLLRADEIIDDKDTGLLTAQGNVEVRVGTRGLKADKLIYDREKQTLRAQGHVEITDESGSVEFADQIETDEKFRNGFATRFSARMPNNGLATASSAVRSDGARNALEQVVYTGCPMCKDNEQEPTWSIRARRAEQNTETQMITYQDAVLEIKGVPVFYLPYFAHPDPTSTRRSGLMVPDVGLSSKVGAFYEQPYYWAISPSQDITVAPVLMSQVNPLLKVDYRKRFFSGFVQAESSATYEQDFNSDGDKFGDKTWRSHLYANGLFQINEAWRWGFGVERQSDDLYDKRYDIDGEDDPRGLYSSQPRQLISQLFTTGQTKDFYFESGAAVIQGLRAGEDDARLPKVAPAIFAEKIYDFGSFGQLAADFSGVALFRDAPQTLPGGVSTLDSARATLQGNWQARYIVGPGLVVEPFATGRGDVYRLDDGGVDGARTISRFLGLAGAQISYPFVRRGENVDIIVEPVAVLAYGTPDANDQGIPNEDSLLVEGDESTLFKPNAVTNYDLWEGGARGTLGLSGTAQFGKGFEVRALVGRRFREDPDPTFSPLSNLGVEKSDYVTTLRVNMGANLTVGARMRIDDNFDANRIDLDVGGQFWRFSGNARYYRIAQNYAGLEDEGVFTKGRVKISDRFSAVFEQQRNITAGRDLRLRLGIAYQDDCSFFMLAYERNGSVDRTLRSYEGLKFTFVLTGLGGVAEDAFD